MHGTHAIRPRRRLFTPALVLGVLAAIAPAATGQTRPSHEPPAGAPPTVLHLSSYHPEWPQPEWQAVTVVVHEFMHAHPGVVVEQAEPLQFDQGALGADSGLLLSIAGDTAPDVMQLWFHQLHTFADRDYIIPLDEFLGDDRNGNGRLDDDEIIWPDWRYVPANVRAAARVRGRLYALPYSDDAVVLLYRKDLFREVGLDPEHPPQTWDEFLNAARKLTRNAGVDTAGQPIRARRGFLLASTGSRWLPWLWSEGGDAMRQGRRDPRTGEVYWFPKEAVECVAPDGTDVTDQPPEWRATFADEAGEAAVRFYRRLRWQRFIKDADGEPIEITNEDVGRGAVTVAGREIRFDPQRDVYIGAIRRAETIGRDRDIDLFARGEIAMMVAPIGAYLTEMPITPEQLGFFPFPAGPGPNGRRVVWRQPKWLALSRQLAGDSLRTRRGLAWDLLQRVAGRRTRVLFARLCAEDGGARLLPPDLLEDAGLAAYRDAMPAHFRAAFELLSLGRTEPFVGHWQAVQDVLIGQQVLSSLITDETYDAVSGLRRAETRANQQLFGGRDPQVQQRYRAIARGVAVAAVVLLIVMGVIVGRTIRQQAAAHRALVGRVSHHRRWIAALLLAPALLSILVWAYYPLARGSVMAFQDYRLTGGSHWIGLDNFIDVLAPDSKIYLYFWNTIRFAAWTLALTFFTPIGLALLLSEIPLGKYLFRTVYFLPQVSSGLVILFLWKMFYEPTETGWLNQLVHAGRSLFGMMTGEPIDWLQDRRFAMLAVVLPAMWAGMGIGSLIYLAALKSIPEELYEAAEIDGCGIRRKLWYVTLPSLKPLILINFVGAFIGTFQGMGNILVMTGGGPQESTTVLGLAVWMNAFVYLDFGLATAMAWVLGILLIGFTLWQLRILRRVEFRRAEAA